MAQQPRQFNAGLPRYLVVFFVGWTALCVVAGSWAAATRAAGAVMADEAKASDELRVLATVVSQRLSTARGTGRALALSAELASFAAEASASPEARLADDTARRAALMQRRDVAVASRRLRAAVASVPAVDGLFLMDPRGVVVANADWTVSLNTPGRALIRHQLDEVARRRVERTVIDTGTLFSAPMVVFLAPMIAGGRTVGVLATQSSPDSLSALMQSSSRNMLVMVTDSMGRVVVSSDMRQVGHRTGSSLVAQDSDVLRLPLSSAHFDSTYVNPGNDVALHRVWVQEHLGEFGLTVHVVRKVPEALALKRDTQLIAALVWLLGLVAAGYRARSLRLLGEARRAQHQTAVQQARVAAIVDASYDAVIARDAAGLVTEWNARAEELFGWSASQMVGKDPRPVLLQPGQESRFDELSRPIVAGERESDRRVLRELTLRDRMGGEIAGELSSRSVHDADGAALDVVFVRDISARKAEEARVAATLGRVDCYRNVILELAQHDADSWAKALERLLRAACGTLDVARASFWRLDVAGTQLTCECVMTAAGTDAAAVGAVLSTVEAPNFLRALKESDGIVAHDAWAHEALQELLEGHLRPRDVRAVLDTPVWSEGRLIGVLSLEHGGVPRVWEPETVQFATGLGASLAVEMERDQRRQGERQLAVERERMRRILESSDISLSMWDAETGLVYANPATMLLFGVKRSAEVPVDLSRFAPMIAALTRDGEASDEVALKRADGAVFPCALHLVNLHEPDRTVFIASMIDLSATKAAESAMLAARNRAQEAEAAKSAFLATMSHEIRTPMNGVLAMSEVLAETRLDADQRSILGVVRTSAESLLSIINDILDYSKIEAGKMVLEEVDTPVASLVEDVVQLLAPRAQERGIGLISEIGAEVAGMVRGDPTRLRQVLLNLAGNAIKFTERGRVRIVVRMPKPDVLRMEVHDTGIGLTEAQRDALFQPFVQADVSTSRRFGGSGLGLSISRRLCNMMFGHIGVTSTPGQGSTFWFEVPAPAVAPPDQPTVDIHDQRVALVGFSPEQARILNSYAQQAGMPAALVFDGTPEGIGPLSAKLCDLDLVVLSTYMADAPTAGLQLVRQLRQSVDGQRVSFCLVVPLSLLSSASAAARSGFVATTSEPVRRSRFWHMLAVAAGRAAPTTRDGREHAHDRFVAPSRETAAARRAVVLVAEDNLTNQIVIGRVLDSMGLAHDIVGNGHEALDRLHQQRGDYGMLLTDFHMPEMDGFELTSEWRAREGADSVQGRLPIFALTADAMAGMADRCRLAGMDGYLTKPIIRSALTEAIGVWLPEAFKLRTLEPDDDMTPAAARAHARAVAMRDSVGTSDAAVEGVTADVTGAVDLMAFGEQLGMDQGSDLVDLLVSLGESMQEIPERLHRALRARDRKVLHGEAHSAKGQARSIAATALGDLCSTLQDDSEHAPWEELTRQVVAVAIAHGHVTAEIAALSAPSAGS
ncbi:MAG: ATP-binding protein [Gemmatimonadetes bacterium]|nr:ATP-binding protein [Gemmatimonadota bacterium]